MLRFSKTTGERPTFAIGRRRNRRCSRMWFARCVVRLVPYVSLALGIVYLLFQLELFDDEYASNHPARQGAPSVCKVPLSSETDKENAQEPFVCVADAHPVAFIVLPPVAGPAFRSDADLEIIRNKSPSSPFAAPVI